MIETHSHTSGGPLDYNQITNNIYIGSNQCCVMGIAEVLKNEGVTADISLEDIRLDQPFGVEEYVWLPTPDHTSPTQDQLGMGAEAIDSLVKRNKNVYVHCKHGHGRATTLVAAYFVLRGKTLQEAEDLIKSKRPTIHLQESQREALRIFWKTPKKDNLSDSDKLFTCPACGLHYRDARVAKQCQAWCEEHHSCNLDIIQHAEK